MLNLIIMQGEKFDEPIVIDSEDEKPPSPPKNPQPPKKPSKAKKVRSEKPNLIFMLSNDKEEEKQQKEIKSPEPEVVATRKRIFPTRAFRRKVDSRQPSQKKFEEAEAVYRSYQPKEGKECKIDESAQAEIPLKQRPEEKTTMANTWNPWIISVDESKLVCNVANEYLKAIAAHWPEDICRFNEEIALQYLRQCSYYPKLALKISQESDSPNQLQLLCESLFFQ
eukprot:TRINITY_DN3038_c0_g2_i4.p1 TRINITY_DN3038_c0_g2~~TRINITY_DN3038_c0_g2_i4.p1  ORF type:complete len:224 (+),score=58.48 TRINITY_DN3038_c0_g2_i4:117-788(+)